MPTLVVELVGCVRCLAITWPEKAHVVHTLRSNGWNVRVHAVLEACLDEPPERVRTMLLASVPDARVLVIERERSILNYSALDNARLRPEFLAEHPEYPYSRSLLYGKVSIDKTLSMWYKYVLLRSMRSTLRPDLVWRTRPDYRVTAIDWSVVQSRVSAWGYATPIKHFLERGFTDVDAVVGGAAADWMDELWNRTRTMYRYKPFHPEKMLMHHMLSKHVQPTQLNARVSRCSKYGKPGKAF